jgi:serine/threonine protein kinase
MRLARSCPSTRLPPPLYFCSLRLLPTTVLLQHPHPPLHFCNILRMFSPAFNDLLARCLAKDPSSRISLSEVLQHPFWDVKFPALSLPDQPLAASTGRVVDVMRLSRAMVCARAGFCTRHAQTPRHSCLIRYCDRCPSRHPRRCLSCPPACNNPSSYLAFQPPPLIITTNLPY